MSDHDASTRDEDRAVLETLAETGPLTVPQLAARLRSHPVTVERRCLELQRRGYLRQGTGGKLTLTEPGEIDRAVGE
ncbi:helix-turn-helix domain-containing protein [Halopiger goleimassiliensis]|uniref:helix-turn-helix domain-containing protein n=1 Tax=Halopiger goleimassiliensis TaxID=1293048 RepID=UPI000677FEFE|nr:helix-turn-helix domain-containing protein [Halopiger goleimassiliensis]